MLIFMFADAYAKFVGDTSGKDAFTFYKLECQVVCL